MSVAAPPRPPAPVALEQPRPAPRERDESCAAAWAMIAVLIAFKIVTLALIVAIAQPGSNAVVLLVAMNWPWLLILAGLASLIPFGFWFRLVVVRSRRKRLRRAEWLLE